MKTLVAAGGKKKRERGRGDFTEPKSFLKIEREREQMCAEKSSFQVIGGCAVIKRSPPDRRLVLWQRGCCQHDMPAP